ncbi:hypothetical protein PMZ80_003792 [Knufia obscura]|uniref:Uncharacterized protein n=1 Tax=Knufia obscura TaxID=1635080 RepID=A0ABR0RW42_9EURO|nr:hypothetical protein PMZ80_003792 [Knufia obscura]
MDIEKAEDSDVNKNASLADETTGFLNAGDNSSDDDQSEEIPYAELSTAKDYHKIRWKQLSKNYNDQYLELFRQSQQIVDVDEPLLTSQIGSVVWTTDEKQRFFDALARKGHRNVPAIAAAIKSKSQVEVMQLLLKLKDADIDRQRFSRYAKNVTHAEIDAAIEVDEDLDTLLEDAADALAAFQNYYDLSAAKNKGDGIWLVDNTTAAYIEDKCTTAEDIDSEGDLEIKFTLWKGRNDALGMFHLNTMLELSRDVFMNTSNHSDLDHWTEVAEDDEQPSMTVDAVQTYYHLIKSLVQRVVQSAVFLAESRIRSTTTPAYAPARVLKDTDIVAALKVLNMPVDSFEHWAKFPRRSDVRVVLGGHTKGVSNSEALSLPQVEKALSVRASKGRRRSLSSMTSMSSQEEDAEDEQSMGDSEVAENRGQLQSANRRGRWSSRDVRHDSLSDSLSDEASDTSSFVGSDHSSANAASSTDSHDNGPIEVEQNDIPISRKRRRVMLEEAQDEFLEKLDHSTGVKDASRLRQVLGLPDVKEEQEEVRGKRPKTLRKTVEELQDWSEISFRGSWERKRLVSKTFDDA